MPRPPASSHDTPPSQSAVAKCQAKLALAELWESCNVSAMYSSTGLLLPRYNASSESCWGQAEPTTFEIESVLHLKSSYLSPRSGLRPSQQERSRYTP